MVAGRKKHRIPRIKRSFFMPGLNPYPHGSLGVAVSEPTQGKREIGRVRANDKTLARAVM